MTDQAAAPKEEITAAQLLAAMEQQERQSIIGHKIVRAFKGTYRPDPRNSARIDTWLKEQGKEFSYDNVAEAITTLTKAGELLPLPYRAPEPEPPKFDYMGLTYNGILKMNGAQYKAAYADPVKRPIIDRILQEEQERKR